ncbi:MAG TPA: hypothetical protein VK075_07710 [Pseudogracilibacillus sp.]|nr:hypothetical protein [Pseudogracilibacillus sp.]
MLTIGYVFLLLCGFGFTVIGAGTLILYLNFLPAGVSWLEYWLFVIKRVEAYFLIIGIILLVIAIWRFPQLYLRE